MITVSKQSIFGRMSQLIRANVNAMLDRAEDPEKMLDQMVRDFTNNIAEAEEAIAQTIGNLRMMEDDYKEDLETARSWGQKALAASRKADEFRDAGDSANASKFDNLAKVAIQRQMESESSAKSQEPTIQSQREIVDRLKNGLEQMKSKRQQLVSKRDELVARSRAAHAQAQVHDAVKSIDVMDRPPRWAASRRRSAARRPGCAARTSWPPPPWTPSSSPWRTWESRLRSRLASQPEGAHLRAAGHRRRGARDRSERRGPRGRPRRP